MGKDLETQHDMLRLILQKMEIKTEADDLDEPGCPSEGLPDSPRHPPGMGWRSPVLRYSLPTTASVLSAWGKPAHT